MAVFSAEAKCHGSNGRNHVAQDAVAIITSATNVAQLQPPFSGASHAIRFKSFSEAKFGIWQAEHIDKMASLNALRPSRPPRASFDAAIR